MKQVSKDMISIQFTEEELSQVMVTLSLETNRFRELYNSSLSAFDSAIDDRYRQEEAKNNMKYWSDKVQMFENIQERIVEIRSRHAISKE